VPDPTASGSRFLQPTMEQYTLTLEAVHPGECVWSHLQTPYRLIGPVSLFSVIVALEKNTIWHDDFPHIPVAP